MPTGRLDEEEKEEKKKWVQAWRKTKVKEGGGDKLEEEMPAH